MDQQGTSVPPDAQLAGYGHGREEEMPIEKQKRHRVAHVDAKAGLIKMARILGMSEDQAETCMNSTEGDAAINRIAQEATERYKPAGTPTFVINFRRVDLPQESWAEAQAAIDATLAAGKNR